MARSFYVQQSFKFGIETMLRVLSLKNFVLVDQLELEFSTGLTVLTGETGAGKSILVDAIGLLLGDRADQGVVRHGTPRAELGAIFDLSDLPAVQIWLSEQGMTEEPGDVLIRRMIDLSGRSRAWINGIQATLTQLRELGEMLINIQGQHIHQTLLRAETQRALLDTYAGALPLSREVSNLFRHWKQCMDAFEAAKLNTDAVHIEQTQLQAQIDEVEELALQADEWSALEVEQRRLRHISRLIEGVQWGLAVLSEQEESCQSQLSTLLYQLTQLSEFDPNLHEVVGLLTAAEAQLVEAVRALQHYGDRLEIDPKRLAEVESRIDAIFRLARKYRVEPEQLPEKLAAWRQRMASLMACTRIEGLQTQMQQAKMQYQGQAHKLSTMRKKAAVVLTEKVTDVLQQLAMGGSRFEVTLHPETAPQATGQEQVVFQVATHPTGPLRPLNKIASGGELSRISLGWQVVANFQDGADRASGAVFSHRLPTLIFDEVDVGIGGRVAEIVGRMLARLGKNQQILCITHLPQVAACGDRHLQVTKNPDGTTSIIHYLSESERIDEIARMLGGMTLSEATRQHAKEMLKVPE